MTPGDDTDSMKGHGGDRFAEASHKKWSSVGDCALPAFAVSTLPVLTVSNQDRPATSRSLWDRAYEKAKFTDTETEVLLKAFQGDRKEWTAVSFVEEVKDLTRARCIDCAEDDYSARKSGKRTVIAQRAETIVSAVLQMKDLVSAGLKFDATGYGATAWSVITFSLQVCATQ